MAISHLGKFRKGVFSYVEKPLCIAPNRVIPAAAIRSNGIQTFKIKGDEKPVLLSIYKGFLETNDMKYKLYEAGGRAFAFSPERAWVHFQDITVLDNGQLSFVMAVNSSISRYLCDKK